MGRSRLRCARYGQLVRDFLDGHPAVEIVERDDGLVMAGGGARVYFEHVRRWPAVERAGLRLMRGRVLDVGCGAGRVALELQRRGRDVVGIDASPLAVEVAREHGVTSAHVCRFEELDGRFGVFDTVALYGNNFGLFGGAHRSQKLLRRLHRLPTTRARIVASSLDPYATDDPAHLGLSGRVRLRIRYRTMRSAWFDYLFVSREEMAALADAGGWRLVRTIDGDGPSYVGVLERRRRALD